MIKFFKNIIYKIKLLYWKRYYKNAYLCDCLTIYRLEHCLKMLNIWNFEILEDFPHVYCLTLNINENFSKARKQIIKEKIYEKLPVGLAFYVN